MESVRSEILFRGKRIDNGEWVYGVPLFDWAGCSLKCEDQHKGELLTFLGWDDPFHEYDYFDDVDPATVGQYTGLTDKNGQKIFEGDICRCRMMNCDGKIYDIGVYVVEWYKENAMFTLMSLNEELEFGFLSGYEVIGNIHDNPELLEVQQ